MSIRKTHRINDIQDILYALLSKYKTDGTPWSRWTIIRENEINDIVTGEDMAHVYIGLPLKSGEFLMQGGARNKRYAWTVIIGFWVTDSKGGRDEMGVWISSMFYAFDSPRDCMGKSFSGTLGTTEYTLKNLNYFGMRIESIEGPGNELEEDVIDHRRELTLTLIA